THALWISGARVGVGLLRVGSAQPLVGFRIRRGLRGRGGLRVSAERRMALRHRRSRLGAGRVAALVAGESVVCEMTLRRRRKPLGGSKWVSLTRLRTPPFYGMILPFHGMTLH